MLTDLARRGPRGKPSGYQGQASWTSSVINLVNTSESMIFRWLDEWIGWVF